MHALSSILAQRHKLANNALHFIQALCIFNHPEAIRSDFIGSLNDLVQLALPQRGLLTHVKVSLKLLDCDLVQHVLDTQVLVVIDHIRPHDTALNSIHVRHITLECPQVHAPPIFHRHRAHPGANFGANANPHQIRMHMVRIRHASAGHITVRALPAHPLDERKVIRSVNRPLLHAPSVPVPGGLTADAEDLCASQNLDGHRTACGARLAVLADELCAL